MQLQRLPLLLYYALFVEDCLGLLPVAALPISLALRNTFALGFP